ncbi:segregation/condensation protein A [Halobacteriales archaeon QS_8_69_26]|nr:MAG: segregation/condensation protein A [Halobacteriales archaeon QS_8_69_26]
MADGEDGAGEETTDEAEVEPVEVLVGLAKDGEIDPWDIDIVTVTDEFLARLDEADLRGSGRALFYASVLLRMKGDELLSEDDEEPEPDPWEEPGFGPGAEAPPEGFDPIEGLEGELERRLDRKRARGTPETLDELVRELREAEREARWKDSREYDTTGGGYRRGTQTLDYRANDGLRADEEPTEAEVTANTHTEDVEALVAEVHAELRRHYEAGREEVLFAEIREAAGSTVETYLGLLFLSHRGHVRLQQDDLFGDLWIRDPGATGAESKGVAD